jgi:hypothetical protein
MKHPSRVLTREARTRARADFYADSEPQIEFTETAKANARAGALHGFVLALAILLVVIPIILMTNGCSVDPFAAEWSMPGFLLTARPSRA